MRLLFYYVKIPTGPLKNFFPHFHLKKSGWVPDLVLIDQAVFLLENEQ